MITMLLGGLWHGAAWTFVIWGGLHGLYLAVNHAWRFLCAGIARRTMMKPPAVLRVTGRVLAPALTLMSVIVAWVFFRARSETDAVRIIGSMFAMPAGAGAPAPAIGLATVAPLAGGFAVALLARNSQELIDGPLTRGVRRIAGCSWGVEVLAAIVGAEVTAIALVALISASRSVTEFIYFNF